MYVPPSYRLTFLITSCWPGGNTLLLSLSLLQEIWGTNLSYGAYEVALQKNDTLALSLTVMFCGKYMIEKAPVNKKWRNLDCISFNFSENLWKKKDSQIKHKPRTSFSIFRHKSEDYIENARLITCVMLCLLLEAFSSVFFAKFCSGLVYFKSHRVAMT